MDVPISKDIAVFAHFQIPNLKKSDPVGYVDPIEAIWLVEQGFAEWRNSRKGIQLRSKPFDLRGISCMPTPGITDAAANGKTWAIAIVDAWRS